MNSAEAKLEMRILPRLLEKLQSSDISQSIMSNGSIYLEGLTTEQLCSLSSNFDISDMTSNSLKESMETMQNIANRRDTSKFISTNKLALVLKKLQEGSVSK
jgi:hypothetical protein